jgi:HPr kinase/phosphorylase
MIELPVKEFLKEKDAGLDLHLIVGKEGLNRKIASWIVNRLSLALSGEADILSSGQLQILDLEELDYLRKLDFKEKATVLRRIFSKGIPCFIVTSNFEPPQGFIKMAQKARIPVLRTPISVSTFVNRLSLFFRGQTYTHHVYSGSNGGSLWFWNSDIRSDGHWQERVRPGTYQ